MSTSGGLMKTTLQNPGSRHHQEQIVCPLLGGEVAKETYKDLTYLCPYSIPCAIRGTLVLTNFKLYFKSFNSGGSEDDDGGGGGDEDATKKPFPTVLDLPLGFISRVEKMGGQRSSGDKSYGLEIVCKDMRNIRFALNKFDPSNPARNDVYEKLRTLCFPMKNKFPMFAFEYKDRYPEANDGWKVYDPIKEFTRQKAVRSGNTSWRVTRVNHQWKLCETYPQVLVVPSEMSDDDLREVAKFRSKERFPVLAWMHPDSQATICRCAQPLVGVGKTCTADEEMVQHIMGANAGSHRIAILDARPKVNAIANTVINGGGYEDENVYDTVDFEFLNIHNIHVMRESHRKLKDVCFPQVDEKKWIVNVDNTQWMQHLRSILRGVIRIVVKVQMHSTSVIVHCSDGWDRTAQLVSLAMLMLDPYYRTLEGYQVLVEKEWLSMGHKFAQRIGHGEDKHNGSERSPVFLQFVDCTWQIMNQFCHCFEFNEAFLVFVLDHLYSCLFGTFLYNSDKERHVNQVREQTQSLWSFVNSERKLFLNPSFRDVDKHQVIVPESDLKHLKVWTGYYCRWNPGVMNRHTVDPAQVRKNFSRMLAINDNLRAKLNGLKKERDTKRKSNVSANDFSMLETSAASPSSPSYSASSSPTVAAPPPPPPLPARGVTKNRSKSPGSELESVNV